MTVKLPYANQSHFQAMASDIRTSELKEPVDVAEYLFRRLHEVGVRGVHGVPGDYNLVALDYLAKTGLDWVGNVNELNAGAYSSSSNRGLALTPVQATQQTATPASKASVP